MAESSLALEDVPHLQPPLPIRRLHNFVYCPRLAYYQWVENLFEENADTIAGSHAHRNVDKPGRWDEERRAALCDGLSQGQQLRSLRLEDAQLGIVGMMDLVEGGPEGAELVDYKKGSARRSADGERLVKESDAIQIAAQALLLAAHGTSVSRAWVYYAEDRRRVPVELTSEIFQLTRDLIQQAKAQAASGHCPPPLVNDSRCLHCSAYPICLPGESRRWAMEATPVHLVEDQQMTLTFSEWVPQPVEKSEEIREAPRPPGDEGEILIVQAPGAQVGQRGGEFTVSVKGQVVQKMAAEQLRAIYLYGAVQLTAQATASALERGIDVSYFSPAGRFLGLLRGLPASGIDARRGQYHCFEKEPIRLLLARECIRGKIHNQRVLLMRNGDAPDAILRRLAELRDQTSEARDLTMLMGMEGMAAQLYFQHFTTMLKSREGWVFDFNGRNRRPPRDPLNALLSLGYSMLAKEITGVCHSVGLDPFLGFLHQPRYGRPALALDLMEEFRPLIADSVAISLLNRGELSPSDFITATSGTVLNEHGRRAYWASYFKRMDTEVTHPQFGYKMSYRRMLEVQTRQLWRYLRGEAVGYNAFTTR
jgi:CRISP-associated protein Cas1